MSEKPKTLPDREAIKPFGNAVTPADRETPAPPARQQAWERVNHSDSRSPGPRRPEFLG